MEKDNIIEIKYPHPHFKPQSDYSDAIDEEGCIDSDIGYLEGEFSDERPFRVECWAIDDVKMATIYFSDRNIKKATKEELIKYLEDEKLLRWLQKRKNLQCRHVKDDVDISMWAVNIKLCDARGKYAEINGELIAYENPQAKD
ncbi:MAG: hypothetical protein EOL98_04695 [Negativicutes bacterium]|nr:hypothetical protein [Negativicutes bacterium]